MGTNIGQSQFQQQDYQAFQEKLQDNLVALKQLMASSEFGKAGKDRLAFGAELEMYIIGEDGFPLCINQTILDQANDPQLTLELNRYNLEYNLTPYSIQQQPLSATEQEICQQLRILNELANKQNARILPIGILPTLRSTDFGPASMTDRQRYHALVKQLVDRRGSDFEIHINGQDPLQLQMQDVTLEGANTSFQVHYRVSPDEYVNTFNAMQLVTPLVLAVAANSPGIFGHDLWCETRIPLFKQSIDTRHHDRYSWREPARVNFGHGWARQSAFDLFQQTASIYPPLLPICSDENPFEVLQQGGVPSLEELCLHQSSVWLWNRPVYGKEDGGHLRIEMRALPAGPSAIDMIANAAFYIGLAEAFKNDMPELCNALPFNLAEYNFYRAAQHGMDAEIIWPEKNQSGCKPQAIYPLLGDMVQRAHDGLLSIGINQQETAKYMAVIENRIAGKISGASWQRKRLAALEKTCSSSESQHMMLEEYFKNSLANIPVSEWSC